MGRYKFICYAKSGHYYVLREKGTDSIIELGLKELRDDVKANRPWVRDLNCKGVEYGVPCFDSKEFHYETYDSLVFADLEDVKLLYELNDKGIQKMFKTGNLIDLDKQGSEQLTGYGLSCVLTDAKAFKGIKGNIVYSRTGRIMLKGEGYCIFRFRDKLTGAFTRAIYCEDTALISFDQYQSEGNKYKAYMAEQDNLLDLGNGHKGKFIDFMSELAGVKDVEVLLNMLTILYHTCIRVVGDTPTRTYSCFEFAELAEPIHKMYLQIEEYLTKVDKKDREKLRELCYNDCALLQSVIDGINIKGCIDKSYRHYMESIEMEKRNPMCKEGTRVNDTAWAEYMKNSDVVRLISVDVVNCLADTVTIELNFNFDAKKEGVREFFKDNSEYCIGEALHEVTRRHKGFGRYKFYYRVSEARLLKGNSILLRFKPTEGMVLPTEEEEDRVHTKFMLNGVEIRDLELIDTILGLTEGTTRSRVNRGWTAVECIRTAQGKEKLSGIRGYKLPNGVIVSSYRDVDNYYGLSKGTSSGRVGLGWTLQEIANNKKKKPLVVVDNVSFIVDNGVRLDNCEALDSYHGLVKGVTSMRLCMGWSMEECAGNKRVTVKAS